MSYEHCEKHDLDATNGCPKCGAEELVEEAFEVAAELLGREQSIAEAAAGGALRKMLAVAYLRGREPLDEPEVRAAIRVELEKRSG